MAWLLGALALALLAAAALLLRQARDGARRQASEAFLERQLELRPGQPGASQASAARRRLPISNGAWRQLLLRAGVEPTPRFLAASVGAHLGVPALAWLFGGWISAAAALLLVALLWYFHLWLKADRRRMVHQLPTFLDALVRLITIGNSVNAAFQNALGSVEQPLLEVLQRADSQVRSGRTWTPPCTRCRASTSCASCSWCRRSSRWPCASAAAATRCSSAWPRSCATWSRRATN